jgi:hypothetical protein
LKMTSGQPEHNAASIPSQVRWNCSGIWWLLYELFNFLNNSFSNEKHIAVCACVLYYTIRYMHELICHFMGITEAIVKHKQLHQHS